MTSVGQRARSCCSQAGKGRESIECWPTNVLQIRAKVLFSISLSFNLLHKCVFRKKRLWIWALWKSSGAVGSQNTTVIRFKGLVEILSLKLTVRAMSKRFQHQFILIQGELLSLFCWLCCIIPHRPNPPDPSDLMLFQYYWPLALHITMELLSKHCCEKNIVKSLARVIRLFLKRSLVIVPMSRQRPSVRKRRLLA